MIKNTLWSIVLGTFLLSCQAVPQKDSELQGSFSTQNQRVNSAKSKYDPVHVVGAHKGKRIDTDRWRPAFKPDEKILKKLHAQMGPRAREYHYATNIKANGVYQTAAIPRSVKEVGYVIDFFESIVPAAHNMIWFKFSSDDPIILFDNEAYELNGQKIYDLFLTSEAARPKDVPYDAVRGTFGDYILVHNFVDMHYLISERLSEREDMINYALDLQQIHKDSLLQVALERSDADGYLRLYNTLTEYNCHGSSLKMIDTVKGHSYPYTSYILQKASWHANVHPAFAKTALSQRHIQFTEDLIKNDLVVNDLLNKAR